MIPTFVADLRLTYAAAIMTAHFWTYTAVQVPIGLLADRLAAAVQALAFVTACFTRDTGRRAAPA